MVTQRPTLAWFLATIPMGVLGHFTLLKGEDCNGNGRDDISEVLRTVVAPNPRLWPAGVAPRAVVSGDIDADGDLDLVTADFSGAVRVFRNQEGLTFMPEEAMPVSIRAESIAGATSLHLVDVERDGDLDLVAAVTDWNAEHRYGALFTFRNQGAGVFEEPLVESLGGGLRELVILDVNGDGAMDAAASSVASSTVTIFENRSGRLVMVQEIQAGGQPAFLSAADWDGDGLMDLLLEVYASPSRLVLLSNERGSFSEPIRLRQANLEAFVAGDIDGDDIPEAIMVESSSSDRVLVFKNHGGVLGLAPLEIPVPERPLLIHLHDIDADGRRDLALLHGTSLISILRQGADGLFAKAHSYFAGRLAGNDLTTGDFDLDGHIDIAVTVASSNSLALLSGREDGTLVSPRVVERSAKGLAARIKTADVTGDASPDIIYLKAGQGTPSVLIAERNHGDGTFSLLQEIDELSSTAGFEVLDVDGDEDLDVALVERGGNGSLGVFRNVGEGTFDEALWFEVGGHMTSVHTGDYNGDDSPDFVLPLEFPAGISVLLNSGDGAFQPPSITTWPQTSFSPPVFLLSGDFNSDGLFDALVGPYVMNPTTFYSGRGTGKFARPILVADVMFSYSAEAADLDKDGDADVVAAEHDIVAGQLTGEYEVLVYANDGSAHFALQQEIPIPRNPLSLLLADLDGDSAPEVLVTCAGRHDTIDDGAVAVLMNDGSGRFSQPTMWLAGYKPSSAAFSDIDGDGSHDLVVAAEGELNGPPGELLVLSGISRPGSTDSNADRIPDECQSPPFHRGDANGDNILDISDPLCVLHVLFLGHCSLDCLEAADANNDGNVDCSDPILTFGWLFLGTEPPAPPGPEGPEGACGVDMDLRGTPKFLDCESYGGCT